MTDETLLSDLAAYLAHPRCQNETLYEGHPTVLIRRAYEALVALSPAEHRNSADMSLFKESIGRVDMTVEVDKQRLT